MPIYEYRCPFCLKVEDHYRSVEGRTDAPECHRRPMERLISAPMVVPDLPGYQSPVDGRWIEGRNARREDLARNNCVPYEPSMKADQARRLAASNAAIDAKVDAHVESEISRMPARKRELLEAELRGSDVTVQRSSVPAGTRVDIAP